jgi:PPOX class probable F420-dependent enzyme
MEATTFHFSEAQRAFLDDVQYAVVGTLNADGSIQQTVIWYGREGDEIRFSLGANSIKAKNLRRNPAVTLTIEAGPRYLTVSGIASVEPVDPQLRLRLATRYLGAEKAAEWMARQPERERASVRVKVLKAYGQGV